MSYDQEFEAFWKKYEGTTSWKEKAYDVWQAAKAPTQMEVKLLELNGGRFFISSKYVISEENSTEPYKNGGRERKTREQAEAAAEKMRKRDRIHAFVTEHCGYEYEWSDTKYNHFIAFSHSSNTYIVNSNDIHESLGIVYMPRETAEYLCAALNDGRLIL